MSIVTLYLSDEEAAPANPVLLYLNNLSSPRSKATMRQALDTVARIITDGQFTAEQIGPEWARFRRERMISLSNQLAQRYAPATANRLMTAVKQVLKECWRLELIPAEDYHRAIDIKLIKGERLPAGRDLSRDEIVALLRTCWNDSHPAGVRDAAIIAVLWSGGLRRAELTALELADYDREQQAVTVQHGKGNKARRVPLDDTSIKALEKWLLARGAAPGALWYKFTRTGVMLSAPVSSQGIYDMLKRRGQRAGIAGFSTHDFRRTCAGDLLDAGNDIVTVQKILGHADPGTTSHYDRRGFAVMRRAANSRQLPDQE